MLTRGWSAFETDLRHVADEAVSRLALSLRSLYLDVPEGASQALLAKHSELCSAIVRSMTYCARRDPTQ